MIDFKVFRYSFSEAIPILYNRFKSNFILVWSLYFHQWFITMTAIKKSFEIDKRLILRHLDQLLKTQH